MLNIKRRELNLHKTTVFTVVINALQIAAALVALCLSLFTRGHAFTGTAEMMLLIGLVVVVCWGAMLDIREAIQARHVGAKADTLEDVLEKLNQQQATLRAQRHDFMNHLQVVYSLMEMQEYEEAGKYIERVYGDIQRVNRTLKTAHPAINALLAAKMSDCEQRGIALRLDIASPWHGLEVPAWEICRVLGNLIDNAMDALRETRNPEIRVSLGENLHQFSFSVGNNGPQIAPENRARIFQTGFSTKSAGRGMGLAIVQDIVKSHGGTLNLTSEADETVFSIELPKNAAQK